jgi:hypothetical protein
VTARFYLNADLDFLIKLAEDRNHTIQREAIELHVADTGEVGMDNACRLLGGARRLATLVHYADDLGRENRLGPV